MELDSTERGGWVFIVTPISAVLQPYKVISVIGRPKNCGWYKLASVVPLVQHLTARCK